MKKIGIECEEGTMMKKKITNTITRINFKKQKMEIKIDQILKHFNQFNIILTIPHNVCTDGTSLSNLSFDQSENQQKLVPHLCDFIAAYAARCLIHNIINPKVFFGNINRTKCDLNRKHSRRPMCGPLFRDKLTRHIKNKDKKNKEKTFVLDVHSFPDSWAKWSKGLDCYLLDDVSGFTSYSKNFVGFLKNKGFNVSIQRGKGFQNDIMYEMRYMHGIRCFLIEFNEMLFKNKKRLQFLCKTIASWLNSGSWNGK